MLLRLILNFKSWKSEGNQLKKKKKLFIFLFPRCSNYYFIIFHENKKGTYILVWYVIKIRIVRYTVEYNTNNIIISKPLYPKIFLNSTCQRHEKRKKRDEEIFFSAVLSGMERRVVSKERRKILEFQKQGS